MRVSVPGSPVVWCPSREGGTQQTPTHINGCTRGVIGVYGGACDGCLRGVRGVYRGVVGVYSGALELY